MIRPFVKEPEFKFNITKRIADRFSTAFFSQHKSPVNFVERLHALYYNVGEQPIAALK